MGATVTWEGLEGWISLVVDMWKTTPEKVKEIMGEIGEDAKGVMDAHTPVGHRVTKTHKPGTLKAGNTLTETDEGFDLSNAVEYADFVNSGTKKMKAQPFLDPAVEHAKQEMDARLPNALEVF